MDVFVSSRSSKPGIIPTIRTSPETEGTSETPKVPRKVPNEFEMDDEADVDEEVDNIVSDAFIEVIVPPSVTIWLFSKVIDVVKGVEAVGRNVNTETRGEVGDAIVIVERLRGATTGLSETNRGIEFNRELGLGAGLGCDNEGGINLGVSLGLLRDVFRS